MSVVAGAGHRPKGADLPTRPLNHYCASRDFKCDFVLIEHSVFYITSVSPRQFLSRGDSLPTVAMAVPLSPTEMSMLLFRFGNLDFAPRGLCGRTLPI